MAAFLIARGYTYFTIRDASGMEIEYPTTMDAAKRFVDDHHAEMAQHKVRHKHSLEQRLDELRRRPPNRTRDELIDSLSAELSKLG